VIKGQEELKVAYQDEDVAQNYVAERFRTPLGAMLHDAQTRTLRQLIAEQGFTAVAEVAPGPARVTVDVLPDLPNITIVDASAQMLGEARRRLHSAGLDARARLLQADAFQLPLRRAAFELVFSFRLIRHFHREDRLKLYGEIAAALKPGGWLVFDAVNEAVSTPLRRHSRAGEYEHFDALLTADAIRAELEESGFSVVALTGVQHRYPWLRWCQVYVAPRSAVAARAAMWLLDRTGGPPLEWVVTCRRQ
jgi:ubiquinone/menaquinone biosynthesis C-methylase UbiE